MFVVKTKLAMSSIHGVGVFAGEFIPANSIVWQFHKGLDVVISHEQLAALPEATQGEFTHYAYLCGSLNAWVLCAGNASFINHSETPNLTWDASEGPYYNVVMVKLDNDLTDEQRTTISRDWPVGISIDFDTVPVSSCYLVRLSILDKLAEAVDVS